LIWSAKLHQDPDRRNLAANGRWGEHHAGNHKGKRHTDK